MDRPATLQEIASALSLTKQAVSLRAEKEAWPYHAQPVRGGLQRLYPLDTLPQAIRDAIDTHRAKDRLVGLEQHLEDYAASRKIRLSPKQIDDPDTWKKLHCLRVLSEAPAYARDGTGKTAQADVLAERYGVKRITIYRWAEEAESWTAASVPQVSLAGQTLELPKTRKFSEPAVRRGIELYGQNIRRGLTWAYRQLRAEAQENGWSIGDYSNFTRLINQIPDVVWDACRRGMVAVERDFVPKVTRAWLEVPVYSVLCGDQNVDDCLAVDPVTGEIVVMNDYLWMDCTSRAIVGMWPSFGPYNRYTVAYSLRMAFGWGFADQVYTDWGGPETSHNTADLIQGLTRFCQVGTFEDFRERFSDIQPDPEEGVEHRKARAGIPWHKPIENVMNQYRRYRLDREIPGFRQRSNEPWENKAIQAEVKRQREHGELWTLERHLEERLAILQQHNAKLMKIREGGGQTIVPGDILNQGLAAQPGRTRADDLTLDLLFLPRFERTPKQGTVQVKFPDGTRYYQAGLELSRLKKGERVCVHADPFDPERPAIISYNGEYLCLAGPKKDINPVTREGLSDSIREQRSMLKWWRTEIEKLVGLPVGDRGLVRVGKATQLARKANQAARDRAAMKDDQLSAQDKIIKLAERRK